MVYKISPSCYTFYIVSVPAVPEAYLEQAWVYNDLYNAFVEIIVAVSAIRKFGCIPLLGACLALFS